MMSGTERISRSSIAKIILFAVAFLMMLLLQKPLTAHATEALDYIDENGDEAYCSGFYGLPEETTWGTEGEEVWYCANETDYANDDRITVKGTVNLILKDGTSLSLPKGISVLEGSTLNIYGQKDGTGELVAKTVFNENAAAIGGYKNQGAGAITINGGRIIATGGFYGSAAIGGSESGKSGTLTINGGFIKATGGEGGVAIGAGRYGTDGNVIINGGTVQAVGGINTYEGKRPYFNAFRKAPTVNNCRVYAGNDTSSVEEVNYYGLSDKTFTQNIEDFVDPVTFDGWYWVDGSVNRSVFTGNIFVCIEECTDHVPNMKSGENNVYCKYCGKSILSLSYIDENGDEAECNEFNAVPLAADGEMIWGKDGEKSWFAVVGDSVIRHPIFMHGDVNLIICDGASLSGCTLIVGGPGQEVAPSLTIYGQPEGTGVIEAVGFGEESAAIGSWCYCETGDITITGGRIKATATGGNAGIGGGMGSSNGHVTIIGDEIDASGYKAIGNGRGGSGITVDTGDMVVKSGGIDKKTVELRRAESCVTYIDASGEEARCANYSILEDYDAEAESLGFGTDGEESWYVVTGNSEIDKQIFLHGDVNLILCDGASLKSTKGMVVNLVDSLTIYCQEEGTGALEAYNEYGNSAAIGSFCWNQVGTITIYGGNITAISENGNAAGIGGGPNNNGNPNSNYSDDDVYIYIYGGTVTAKGHMTDAIGNGEGGEHIVVCADDMSVVEGGLDQQNVKLKKCSHDEYVYYLKDKKTIGEKCAACGKEDEDFESVLEISQDRVAGTLTAGFSPEINKNVTYQWYIVNGAEEQAIDGEISAVYALPEDWESGSHDFRVKATLSESGITAECDITATAHEHDFIYEADGEIITATCQSDEDGGECTLEDSMVALTLIAPERTVYGGEGSLNAGLGNLDAFKKATGLDIVTANIRYTGIGGTVYRRSATPPSHAGTYAATITVEDATATVEYTIRKAELTVTAKDHEISYGEEPGNAGVEYAGFAEGDDQDDLEGALSCSYDYSQFDNVGEYTITPEGLSSRDYAFSYAPGKLTVSPAQLNVFWEGLAPGDHDIIVREYNGKKQIPAVRLDGVVNSDDVSVAVKSIVLIDHTDCDPISPDMYRLTVTLTGSKAGNYWIEENDAQNDLEICRATLPDITINRTYISSAPEEESIDLSGYLPADAPEAGFAELGVNPMTMDNFEIMPSMNGSKLEFKLKAGLSSIETVKAVVSGMRNYNDFNISFNLKPAQIALYEQADKGKTIVCNAKTLTVDKSFVLVPKFADGAVVNNRVIWESSNPDVASITQDGKVTGRSAGTTTIRCLSEQLNALCDECVVTVTDPATDVVLDRKSYSFGVGESVTINASLLPITATEKLNWTVDNPKGAVSVLISSDTMSATITGTAEGSAKITAETADGTKKKATCTLNVGTAAPDFQISAKGGATGVQVGKTLNMVVDWGQNKPKNTDVIWSAETVDGKRSVASVSEKGVVSGVAEGKVKITATSVSNPDKSASAVVDVYVPIKSVKLNATTAVVSRSEDANPFMLSAEVTSGIAGMSATGVTVGTRPTVEYAVDPNFAGVISVDRYGKVSVIDENGTGTVKDIKVSATVRGYGFEKTLQCKVTVKDDNYLKGIKMASKAVTIGEGNVAILTASLDPVNPDGNTGIVWESENPAIATVENGKVVGISAGTTIITATAMETVSDKSGKVWYPQASCKVTVAPSVTGISFANGEDLVNYGLATGKSYTLKPEFAFSGNAKPAGKDLFWESSDETIASVTQKGAIKALKSGTVTVTATSMDVKNAGKPASVSVTFSTFEMIKSVKIDRSKLTLGTRAGVNFGKIGITSIVPEYADNPTMLWTADNDKVLLAAVPARNTPVEDDFEDCEMGGAAITGRGEAIAIQALMPGVVKLTGETLDGSKKKVTCTITVKGEVTKIQLQPNAGKNGLSNVEQTAVKTSYTGNMKRGTNLTLKVVPEINYISGFRTENEVKKLYAEYQKVTDTSVSYRSSDTSKATVDKNGKIIVLSTAAPNTDVTITVTSADGKKSAQYTIHIKE